MDGDVVAFGMGDCVLGGEVGGCRERVEFADGGVGVIDVEVGQRGGAGAAIESPSGNRDG